MEAYHIYSGIMAQFLYLKIGPKIDCVVYILMYVMIKANIVQFCGPVETYCGRLDLVIPLAHWAIGFKT